MKRKNIKKKEKKREEERYLLKKLISEDPRRCFGLYIPLPLATVIQNRIFSEFFFHMATVINTENLVIVATKLTIVIRLVICFYLYIVIPTSKSRLYE